METFFVGFLVVFTSGAAFAALFGLSTCARRDFILAALFAWIMCFFAALSRRLAALESACTDGFAFAVFTASFTTCSTFERSNVRRASCRNFFFADFITGMVTFYHVIL